MPVSLFVVENAKEFRKALKETGDDLADLKGVYRAVGAIVAAYGAVRAPKRSGRLVRTVRGLGSTTSATVRGGRARTVEYAAPIHWGWPSRGIAPNTFLVDAAQDSEPVWLAEFTRHIDTIRRERGL